MSRVRLNASTIGALRTQALLQEVRALRAALAVADELHDAAATAIKEPGTETAEALTKVRAKYRVARKKVPS